MASTLATIGTLRTLIGIAGFGYSLYTRGWQNDSADNKNFNQSKLFEAIYGGSVGNLIYDFLKSGATNTVDLINKLNIQGVDELNHDLQRAARKSQLMATSFACQSCLANLKFNRSSYLNKLKNFVLTDNDVLWLEAVNKNLKVEIEKLPEAMFDTSINYQDIFNIFDKDKVVNKEEAAEEFSIKIKIQNLDEVRNNFYSKLLGQISVDFSQGGYDLLKDAILNGWDELKVEEDEAGLIKLNISNLQLNPHGKKYDWFNLVCILFNEEFKTNQKIQSAIQKRELLEIKSLSLDLVSGISSLGLLDIKIDDLTQETLNFREESLNLLKEVKQNTQALSQRLKRFEVEFDGKIFTEPKITHNFPASDIKPYGRDREAEILRQTLCGETFESKSKRFSLIVAPSGFGKTILLEKTLKEVAENGAILPKFQANVQQILLIDCGIKQNLSSIVGDFNELLGTQEIYDSTIDEVRFAQKLIQLPKDKVWLILDNFEKWLDNSYEVTNSEIRAFLNALFSFNENIRGIILSQSIPNSFINQLNILSAIGKELYRGLPEDVAIKMLRESNSGELDNADESLLKQFLGKVCYIPQAISSLIGYLRSRTDYTFVDFMSDESFWGEFDSEEQNSDALARGERRTKALIKRQIECQSAEVKTLLQTLSFFGREVSIVALETLFENKAHASSHISRLSSHHLTTKTSDLSGNIFYSLHNYFREQTLINLPNLGRVIDEEYAKKLLQKSEGFDNEGKVNLSLYLGSFAEQVFQSLVAAGKFNLEFYIADSKYRKGIELWHLGKLKEAIIEFDEALSIFKKLRRATKIKSIEIQVKIASAIMHRGLYFQDFGYYDESIYEFNQSIKIYLKSLKDKRATHNELINLKRGLAKTYMNKGNSLDYKRDYKTAIKEYDKSINLSTFLIDHDDPVKIRKHLAKCFINKGLALWNLKNIVEAIAEFERASSVIEIAKESDQDPELLYDLAISYNNKGYAYAYGFSDRFEESIIEYDKSIQVGKALIKTDTRSKYRNQLARSFMNKGVSLINLKIFEEAVREIDESIKLREVLVNDENHHQFANDLAESYLHKGRTLEESQNYIEAIFFFSRAINLWENFYSENIFYYLTNLILAISLRIKNSIDIKDWEQIAHDLFKVSKYFLITKSTNESSFSLEQKINKELKTVLELIKQIPEDSRELIFAIVNELGLDQEDPIHLADIWRKFAQI